MVGGGIGAENSVYEVEMIIVVVSDDDILNTVKTAPKEVFNLTTAPQSSSIQPVCAAHVYNRDLSARGRALYDYGVSLTYRKGVEMEVVVGWG